MQLPPVLDCVLGLRDKSGEADTAEEPTLDGQLRRVVGLLVVLLGHIVEGCREGLNISETCRSSLDGRTNERTLLLIEYMEHN